MTIRILSDREPYSSYAAELASAKNEDAASNDVFLNGPAKLDDPNPDFLVLPAEVFLALPSATAVISAGYRVGATAYLAYGPVDLMESSFERGCADYLREPWPPAELRARIGRLRNGRFRAFGELFELRATRLYGTGGSIDLSEIEKAFLGLLLRNAPNPIPRAAAEIAVFAFFRSQKAVLGPCAVSLRRKMESLHPGLGSRLRAIRGFGYRLDVDSCG